MIATRYKWWKNSHKLSRATVAVLQLMKRNLRGTKHPVSSSYSDIRKPFREVSSVEGVLISFPVFPVGESNLTQDFYWRLFEQRCP